ncbi:MAG: hypothetical protein FJX54_19505 [Alphaproteobacteria bacterium]|nr:hypothetical protein [Alphaproteobacteria bacterium]
MDAAEASRRRIDALAALVVLVVAVVVFFAARREPAPLYDPFGPGTAPMAVSAALAFLAVILLVRTLVGLRVGQSAQSLILGLGGSAPADYRLRPDLALITFVASILFVAAMSAGLPFLWSALAFLLVLGGALSDRRPRSLLIAAAVAVIGAILIDVLFRRVLFVQLP